MTERSGSGSNMMPRVSPHRSAEVKSPAENLVSNETKSAAAAEGPGGPR